MAKKKKKSKGSGKLSKNAFSRGRKKAEEARKSRFENAPVGQHICRFTGFSQGTGKGGDFINMQFAIVDGEHSGKKFSKYYELSEDRLSFILGDLGVFGFELDEFENVKDITKALKELQEEKPLLKIRVSENGEYTNTYINKVFSDEEAETLDIEEDGDEESDDEEEEDEDSEDDEEESDDEEDEDEEEDDEEWKPSKGDRVNVTLADGEEYPGKVTRCSVAKEICSVDFDDGDSETGLAWEDISQLEEDADDEDEEESDEDEEETEDEDDESEDEDSDEEEELTMKKGMRVSFKKGRKTIKGKITKLDEENETVNIKDDKGKTHKKIDGSKLELLDD